MIFLFAQRNSALYLMSTQDVFETYYALRGCLIKERLGRNSVLVFQLNIKSFGCLVKSGSKIIFH